MIKKSITAKLFAFMLILFVGQMIIQYGFQTFFLGNYYESQKIDEVTEALDDLIVEFEKSDDVEDQKEMLFDFIDEYDEPIIVVNSYFEFHPSTYQLAFERTAEVDTEYGVFNIPINESIDSSILELDFDFDFIDQEILIFAYKDGDRIYPIGFDFEGMPYYIMSIEEEEQLMDKDLEIIEFTGTIIDFDSIQLGNEMQSKIDLLVDYNWSEYFDETFENDSSLYEIIEEDEYIDGEKYYFTTMVSLQPINEVMDIQNQFQRYLLIGMLLLIIIVSLSFSKTVSRPIVRITENASAIASMNFDVHCDESRSDEIGVLGARINYLSQSLKSKLEDLESTNEKLEGEIEFERRQEKIRKEFVANVSHELKTPLGVIRSYSEGIMDGISKEKSSYYLSVIVEEVDKMNRLVMDMLELSNLETGHVSIEREEINLKRMVQNLLRPYDAIVDESEIDLTLDLEDSLLSVDVHKMEMVISNLLSNAFRYVDNSRKIIVRLTADSFQVENSCERIPDKDLQKLWDRFYRQEKSRARTLGGNGLGLAIVKHALDLHEYGYKISNTELGFMFQIWF